MAYRVPARRPDTAVATAPLPLTASERVVLRLLASKKELPPLEIVALSNGGIGRSTVYGTLTRLAERGLVESQEWRERQRLFRVTSAGLVALRSR